MNYYFSVSKMCVISGIETQETGAYISRESKLKITHAYDLTSCIHIFHFILYNSRLSYLRHELAKTWSISFCCIIELTLNVIECYRAGLSGFEVSRLPNELTASLACIHRRREHFLVPKTVFCCMTTVDYFSSHEFSSSFRESLSSRTSSLSPSRHANALTDASPYATSTQERF